MVRITRDTRLNNLNLRVQKGPTYVNFEPNFLWVDYESESEEELLSYLRDSEDFSPNPTLYETLALIFHAIQQTGGGLEFAGKAIRPITIEDCSGIKPLQDDTIVIYYGGFFRLGHLLKEFERKGPNPELFTPDSNRTEADEYIKAKEQRK